MKKLMRLITLLACLASLFCSGLKRSASFYPRGVIFPLRVESSLETGGELVGMPVIEAGRLYEATDMGVVSAIDIATQKIVWQHVALGPLVSAPALTGDRLCVADAGGRVSCVDKADGRLYWTIEVKDFLPSWLVGRQDRVCLADKAGLIVCLASVDGHELWRFEAGATLAGPPLLWVWGNSHLLLFMDDGKLQGLNLAGRPEFSLRLAQTLAAEASTERNFVYFGSLDRTLQCWDLAGRKKRWQVKLAGRPASAPLVYEGYLLLWTTYGVLYCLDSSNGDILWWKSIASRLPFGPLVVDTKIVSSASSPELSSFLLKSGQEAGSFDTKMELKGPPLWFDPLLLVNAYDPLSGQARLLFLCKDVSVRLNCSKKSPQGISEEIVFVAQPTGFFKPRYEFFLIHEGREESVQRPSEQGTWSWFPDKEGDFTIKVRVTDTQEKAETEMPFKISGEAAKKLGGHS